MPSGEPGPPADLGDDCAVRSKMRFAQHTSGKGCGENAFDGHCCSNRKPTARMLKGDASADTGAGRAAIDLTFGKNADVAAVRTEAGIAVTVQDGAIQERKLGRKWMEKWACGHHRALYAHCGIDQCEVVRRRDVQVCECGMPCKINVSVKGTPVTDVVANLAQPEHADRLIESERKRGHIFERNMGDLIAIHVRGGENAAGGRINFVCATGSSLRWHIRQLQHAGRQRRGERNDAVSTHAAPALVVHKQHTEIPIVCGWRHGKGAIHVGMAAWLKHQAAADAIQMGLCKRATRDDGVTGGHIDAAGDDAQGFALGMQVERRDALHLRSVSRKKQNNPAQRGVVLFFAELLDLDSNQEPTG